MANIYYPTQGHCSHESLPAMNNAESSIRLTCVNVNHVTYNYLMDNSAPPEAYAYNPYEVTESSFTLPSSCESPMSLPTFSPPMNHYNVAASRHQCVYPAGFADDAVPAMSSVLCTNVGIEDFVRPLEDQCSLDLAGGANSSEDGIRLKCFTTIIAHFECVCNNILVSCTYYVYNMFD